MYFNNGFLTAICLFLEHKMDYSKVHRELNSDLRLYSAYDHLIDIEIPTDLPKRLTNRINRAIKKAYKYRNISYFEVENYPKKVDAIFLEFENIIKDIDRETYNLNVKIKYR